MAEKKMTKAVAMTLGAEALASVNPEAAAVLMKEAAALNARNSAPKKPTATQLANVEVKAAMLAVMEPEVRYLTSEVGKLVGLETPQKASALLHQLVAEGKVVRSTEKGKAYFTKA